jgi:hypothetical protein
MSLKDRYENSKPKIFTTQIRDSIEPVPKKVQPSESDYDRGFMVRYFLKRKNVKERLPFEVDRVQYRQFEKRGSGISRQVYEGAKIKWRLTGPKDKIENSLGYPIDRGVEETNKRLVRLYNEQLEGIDQVLTNPLQFYRGNEDR